MPELIKNICGEFKSWMSVFVLILLIICPLQAKATSTSSNYLDELSQQFHTESVSADFIVLVDTSKSMEGTRFAAVRASLASLAQALSPGDYFCVIGFDKTTHDLIPRHQIASDEMPSLLQSIQNCPEPHATPEAGEQGATDLLVGLDRLIQEILHLKAKPIQFVFLLTDGHDQPPHNRGDDTSAWSNLHAAAQTALKSGGTEVEWLWFDNSATTEHMNQIFPDSIPMVVTPQALKNHFSRLKDDIQIRKLRLLVRNEIAKGCLTLIQPKLAKRIRYKGTYTIPVHLKSNFEHLSIRVEMRDGYQFHSDRVSIGLEHGSKMIDLKPGTEDTIAKLKVRHLGDSTPAMLMSCLIGGLPAISHDVIVPLRLVVEPEEGLRRLDPTLSVTQDLNMKLHVRTSVAPPLAVWLTRSLLICLALILVIQYMVRKGVIYLPKINLPHIQWPWSGR